MIITPTQTLEVVLGNVVAANQSPVLTDYIEFSSTTTTPTLNATQTNSTTPVIVLSAPAAGSQRKVNNLTIFNADTASILVTIQFDVSGTKYEMLKGITVRAGDTLQYTDESGWNVIDSRGILQDLRTGWAQEFLASGIWDKPNNARFVMVEVVGAGGGGGSGGNPSGNNTRIGGGGGGGGIRKQQLFLAADLPSSVLVTVPPGGAGGVPATNTSDGNAGTAGGTASFGTFLISYGGGGGGGGGLGAGGSGAGGTSAGVTSVGAGSLAGGSSFAVAIPTAGFTDTRGGASGAQNSNTSPGFMSYLGGGGGGGANTNDGTANTAIPGAGGNSFFSGAGGGAGATSAATGALSAAGAGGGVGPFLFGPTAYTTAINGSGPQGAAGGNFAAQDSWSVIGFCGTGGAGGNTIYAVAYTGVAGGAGGFPGGGGGGSAGTVYSASVPGSTGARGGAGGAGRVRVWSW